MEQTSMNDDYTMLTQQIQETIKNQNNLYQEMRGSNFMKGQEQFKIDESVEDLETYRIKIWDFLKSKYNENTQMYKEYTNKLNENKIKINKQKKELEKVREELKDIARANTTSQHQIKRQRYIRKRFDYYQHLYYVIIATQILMLIILYLNVDNLISKTSAFIIVLLILSVLAIYILYYVYFNNYNRNKFDWSAFYFDEGTTTVMNEKECPPVVSQEEKEFKEISNGADGKIKNFVKKNCSKK